MKLKDLKVNKSQRLSNVACKISPGSERIKLQQETLRIVLDNTSFAFVSELSYFRFDILDEETKQEVILALQKGYFVLAEIEQCSFDKGLLYLCIVIFSNKPDSFGDISVYVSDVDLDEASKKRALPKNPLEVLKEIAEMFTITIGKHSFFAYSEYEIVEETDVADKKPKNKTIKSSGLVVYGDTAVATIKSEKNENAVIVVCQKISYKIPRNTPNLRLAQGTLFFLNEKVNASIVTKQKLDKIKNSDKGFLAIWDKYKEEERSISTGKSEHVGIINCIAPEFRGELTYAFSVSSSILENLQTGDVLEIISINDTVEADDGKKSVEVVTVGNGEIVVKGQFLVGGERFVLTTVGNDAQMKRRDSARESILNGTCANPTLGLIIEGDLEHVSIRENWCSEKLPALSDFVRKKVFEKNPLKSTPPTPTQEEAIAIALNTPDIAIIQGPPGTGKTTIIVAIIERLNEEYDKSKDVKGKILITGFQHDAVENIISRLHVNSLPTIKFGRRSGDAYSGEMANTRNVTSWCRETAKRIRSNNPQIKLTEQQQRLSDAYTIYIEYPSDNNVIKLLEIMSCMPLSPKDLLEVEDRLSILRENETLKDVNDVLFAIRRLRVTLRGYEDDGQQRIFDLLEKLKSINRGFETDIALLENISKTGLTNENRTELAKTKQKLLDRFIPRPIYKMPKIDTQITSFFESIMKTLAKPQNETDRVIVDFLAELENNPVGIIEALKKYNVVYAATTGQSVAKNIIEAKGEAEYDTVIVDEAARVNPLDLMIPLAKAKRRIILVGDHRQLPHIYNEDIANKITKSEETEEQAETEFDTEIGYIKRSMFEHMLDRAKRLEKIDGIKRNITLDAQYRMHPLLGKFVNDYFYAQYGESFSSPRSENSFIQNLPISNGRPCVWIDIPAVKKAEQMFRDGTSWIREIEAEIIAKQIKELIDSDYGKEYTFGVITFYAAQRDKILAILLEKHGITESQYNVGERLKVGTVDAFQGMEFDVVFLSTVRDRSGAKKRYPFGRLTSENLLCVSMSRQKRLLVAVGDLDYFRTEQAKRSVPALYGFAELCKNNGVII